MKATIEYITPEYANSILKMNTRNRSLNEKHVDYLAREMMAGNWKENGDAIRMNGNILIDGQHRLYAVIKSGITIKSVIVTGISASSFDTIDTGRIRSAGDALEVLGEKNSRNLAAALVATHKYYNGTVRGANKSKMSNHDVIKLLKVYPEMRLSLLQINNKKKRTLLAPSILCSCHYIFSQIDRTDANEFFDRMCDGSGLSVNDPILALRDRLMANASSKEKMTKWYTQALVIKSWNAYRSGKKLKYLRLRTEGDNQETFPVAI